MIELIVVIGIMILAVGMMTPTITDFFKGRQLRQLVSSFRGTINSARLKAVNERTQVRLVFFREGIRVFDERESKFVDEFFNPETSQLAGDKAWYVLGFYGKTPSTRLRRYRDWELQHIPPEGAESKKRRERRRKETRAGAPRLTTRNLQDLPQIIFRRDGSVEFNVGSDVSSIFFKKDPPTNSDLIVYSVGSAQACFIDIQLTGQNRSRLVVLESEPPRPADRSSDDSTGRRKKGNRKSRRSSRR